MKTLADYAKVTDCSQYGEDGMIDFCLRRLDLVYGGVCIEVGAQDGKHLSNTYALRDRGWDRILIESDPTTCAEGVILKTIEPEGPASLDGLVPDGCEFLSLDIDGNDYEILRCLHMRPRLIVAEFHPAIPWHLDLHGERLGCSLRALTRLMSSKNYAYIGATHCNAFFVQGDDFYRFSDIQCEPENALDESNFTYLISTLADGAGEDMLYGPRLFQKEKV